MSRLLGSAFVVLLLASSCRIEKPQTLVNSPEGGIPRGVERILLNHDRIRFVAAKDKQQEKRAPLSWSSERIRAKWSRSLFDSWHLLRSPSLEIDRLADIETIKISFETPPSSNPVRLSLVWNNDQNLSWKDILTYRRDLFLSPRAGTITVRGDNLVDLGFVDQKAVGFIFLLSRFQTHLDFVTGVEIETEHSRLKSEPFGFKRRFVNGSLRDSVFIQSGGQIIYETELSSTTNELVLGVNSLNSGLLNYKLSLASSSDRFELLSGKHNAFDNWKDLRVRLPRMSGTVKLSFECRTDEPNVIFWANPMIISKPRSRSKQNIVLYLMDGLRADHLRVYGYEKPTSPFLDKLSHKAIVAFRAFAAASWTKPSVTSLMTSLYPSRHRLGTTSHTDVLSDDATTIAEILAAGGYVTASFAANPLGTSLSNLDQGFDYALTPEFFVNGKSSARKVPSDSLTSAVLAWLRTNGETPFFLYIHAMDTHEPWIAELRKDLENLDSKIHAYDSSIRQNDEQLERIYGRLSELNRTTLVVIVSDHGESLGDHGIHGHGNSLYQEQVMVPLIVCHPSFNTRVEIVQPVDFFDIGRTILEFSGVDFDRSVWWGRSLMEPLKERPVFLANQTLPDDIIWNSLGTRVQMHGVVHYPWKLILSKTPGHPAELELYELSTDPLELSDLSATHEDIRDKLRAMLLGHIKTQTSRIQTDPDKTVPTNHDINLLRELGYIN